MISRDERIFLGNLLDSLDRLSDGECGAFDLYALLFATSKALSGSQLRKQIEPFIRPVFEIVQTVPTGQMRRDAALIATDDLRKFLATALSDAF